MQKKDKTAIIAIADRLHAYHRETADIAEEMVKGYAALLALIRLGDVPQEVLKGAELFMPVLCGLYRRLRDNEKGLRQAIEEVE